MSANSYFRGHKIYYDGKEWRYCDDKTLIKENIKPCKKCGKNFPFNDIDPCLDNIPGVIAACCGHGIKEMSFIKFKSGKVFVGI